MTINATQVLYGGLIIGYFDDYDTGRCHLDYMNTIVDRLRHVYQLSLVLGGYGVKRYGPFRPGLNSPRLRPSKAGMIIFIANGVGCLNAAEQNISMSMGHWAYVPGGLQFVCQETEVKEPQLSFYAAQLAQG